MSLTSRGFAAEPENQSRTEQAQAEALLSWMEWGQGVSPLESALSLTVASFEAFSGAVTRFQPKSGRSRLIAATPVSNGGHGMAQAPVGQAIGRGLEYFKIGTLVLMSTIENTRLVRNSEFASWKRSAKCADVGFVVLSRSQREADLMILQFDSTPNEDWCEQKQWLASSLARTFEMRRPGLITEALSFESLQTHDAYDSDTPILGVENVLGLTRTEFQVCVLVSRGLAAKSIAAEMGVSTTTVRTHLRNIYTKTGFTGFHQLAKRLISAEEQCALHEPLRMSA